MSGAFRPRAAAPKTRCFPTPFFQPRSWKNRAGHSAFSVKFPRNSSPVPGTATDRRRAGCSAPGGSYRKSRSLASSARGSCGPEIRPSPYSHPRPIFWRQPVRISRVCTARTDGAGCERGTGRKADTSRRPWPCRSRGYRPHTDWRRSSEGSKQTGTHGGPADRATLRLAQREQCRRGRSAAAESSSRYSQTSRKVIARKAPHARILRLIERK